MNLSVAQLKGHCVVKLIDNNNKNSNQITLLSFRSSSLEENKYTLINEIYIMYNQYFFYIWFTVLISIYICSLHLNTFFIFLLSLKSKNLQYLNLKHYLLIEPPFFFVLFVYLRIEKKTKLKKMTTWRNLKIGCPACDKGKDIRSYWYHAEDGKQTQINEKADIRCVSGHSRPFKDWRWDCGKHNGEYKPAEAIYVAAMVQRAMTMMKGFTDEENVDAMWLFSLCANLGKQYECNVFENTPIYNYNGFKTKQKKKEKKINIFSKIVFINKDIHQDYVEVDKMIFIEYILILIINISKETLKIELIMLKMLILKKKKTYT
ncbi:hypothetical protein RFI_17011 [Reticulomyxa filosa]|uniref:Uncharacterized protein n=1 Tax=Reticulomyxa filosa TaxID=46433 RepID=X6N2S9_RETFI|nr:hypothetical protein RFI_17011 [Reticulomyxa filosa]|eukprot:ETO20208.1 hypothetical protein RFI_17011 [Reticulomyxa filosa]